MVNNLLKVLSYTYRVVCVGRVGPAIVGQHIRLRIWLHGDAGVCRFRQWRICESGYARVCGVHSLGCEVQAMVEIVCVHAVDAVTREMRRGRDDLRNIQEITTVFGCHI